MLVGINGFGRIGKTIFLQLLNNPKFEVIAINAPSLKIEKISNYLNYDSTHNLPKNDIKILNQNTFIINNKPIHLFQDRDASKLNWKSLDINIVIDATGVYLTTEKCLEHNVEFVLMTAPPKDKTPIYIYTVNHLNYKGEKVISNASCTTNAITPVLKFLEDNYKIKSASFTTIHAATSSQSVIDSVISNSRTHRSIFNNIIPHTTGATKSILEILPSLNGKIFGTSLRIPTNNVSIVDLVVDLEINVDFNTLINEMSKHKLIIINRENLVSSDFNTTESPSIIDFNASMKMYNNQFKLLIWYDNEWSYSSQCIKLLENIFQ